jgi:hypothetical protein
LIINFPDAGSVENMSLDKQYGWAAGYLNTQPDAIASLNVMQPLDGGAHFPPGAVLAGRSTAFSRAMRRCRS